MKLLILTGIINATPDSFSNDGLYGPKFSYQESAFLDRLDRWIHDGLTVVDIGGQSTRPGSQQVPQNIESDRVLPVIRCVHHHYPQITISVDTFHPPIAAQALSAGATIINDVSGSLQNAQAMAQIIAEQPNHLSQTAQLVLTDNTSTAEKHVGHHALSGKFYRPPAGLAQQDRDTFVLQQRQRLQKLVDAAQHTGIARRQLILDPGLGFGKAPDQNGIAIQTVQAALPTLAHSIMIGASNKSFLGEWSQTANVDERLEASLAVAALVYQQFSPALPQHHCYLRVHNVTAHQRFIKTLDALKNTA